MYTFTLKEDAMPMNPDINHARIPINPSHGAPIKSGNPPKRGTREHANLVISHYSHENMLRLGVWIVSRFLPILACVLVWELHHCQDYLLRKEPFVQSSSAATIVTLSTTTTTTEPAPTTSNNNNNTTQQLILLSLGRSGSTALGYALGGFLTGRRCKASETLGKFRQRVYRQLQQRSDPSWIDHALRKRPLFQWKPYADSLALENAYRALQYAHARGIRVVVNRRNPIDYAISMAKHQDISSFNYTSTTPPRYTPHCKKHQTDCIDKLSAATLVRRYDLDYALQLHQESYHAAFDLLNRVGIPYIDVWYDDLFRNNATSTRLYEWQRLLTFCCNVSYHSSTLILQRVHNFTFTAITAPTHQRDAVVNYDELVSYVQGTEYEQYLH